jgi:glycosyltransferase involved in cell wall biosynthesis
MRILQLAPIWETVPPPAYGGTETVISVLTEELVRQGHDVVLCASGDSRTSATLRTFYPVSLRSAGLGHSALQYAIVHVSKSLRHADEFDIIHNHSGPPSEIAMAFCHMIDTPMLTTMHNNLSEETRYIWSSYTGWYNSISRSQAWRLPRMTHARDAGIVYNAIDIASFPFQPEKNDYLLSIGRIAVEKATHLAIEAARMAGRRLVIAGKISTDDESEYFESEVRPRLGPDIEYFGEADGPAKRQLFAGASALLQPLQWEEPFGLVMAEAMACGTPVIAFNRGAAPEVVDDGQTGFIVEDLREMVEAIGRLDEIDPWACREHVEKRFGPQAMASAYLQVYKKILGITEEVHEPLNA